MATLTSAECKADLFNPFVSRCAPVIEAVISSACSYRRKLFVSRKNTGMTRLKATTAVQITSLWLVVRRYYGLSMCKNVFEASLNSAALPNWEQLHPLKSNYNSESFSWGWLNRCLIFAYRSFVKIESTSDWHVYQAFASKDYSNSSALMIRWIYNFEERSFYRV